MDKIFCIDLEFYDHYIQLFSQLLITLCTFSRQAKDTQIVYWEPLPIWKYANHVHIWKMMSHA